MTPTPFGGERGGFAPLSLKRAAGGSGKTAGRDTPAIFFGNLSV